MYKDIISYELAEGVTKDHLLKVAKEVFDGWMSKQAGFVKWEIHTDKDNNFTDIVFWESAEAAKNSESDMVNLKNAADWFGCYKEGSISSKNLTVVGSF